MLGVERSRLPSFLSYSQTVWVMAIVLILLTFGFGVIYSSFTLFVMHNFGYTEAAAVTLYSLYVSWFFTVSILGGFLGGRFGHRECVWVGCFLLFIAYLGFCSEHWIYWSCASMSVGMGLFFPNAMVVIGHTQRDKKHKELSGGYILLYLSVNIGVLLGGVAAGYLGTLSYQGLFMLAAILVLLAGWVFVLAYPKIQFSPDSHSAFQLGRPGVLQRVFWLIVLSVFLSWGIEFLLQNEFLSNTFVITLGVISLLALLALGFFSFFGLSMLERRALRWFTVMITSTVIFWSLYNLEQSVVVSFFDRSVNRWIGNFEIPSSFLGSFNAMMDIIIGFLLITWFKNFTERFSNPTRAFSAIILMGLAYWLLAWGAHVSRQENYMSMDWVFFAFIIMSVAEMMIGPLSNAIAIEYGPKSLQGFLMGFGQLAMGVAGSVSDYLNDFGIFSESDSNKIIIPHMAGAFGLYGFLGVTLGGLLLLFYWSFRNFRQDQKFSLS